MDTHHLTRDQVAALLSNIEDRRQRTAVLVMYLHGLRVSEVCGGIDNDKRHKHPGTEYRGLRREDVQDGYIVVKRLKGSEKTTHTLIPSKDPLFDEVSQLEDIITQFQLEPGDRLFPYHRTTLHRAVKKAGIKAGIPALLSHTHVFKHSIAMQMVKKIDIAELKQYLGHKSLNSTGRYLRVSDAQASKAVMDALEKP